MLEEIKKPFYSSGALEAPSPAPAPEPAEDAAEPAEETAEPAPEEAPEAAEADEAAAESTDEPKKPKQSESAIARNSLRSRASKLREQLLASDKEGAKEKAEAIGAENDPKGAYGKSVQAEIIGDKDDIDQATNELAQAVFQAKFHLEKKPTDGNATPLAEETGEFHQERSDILVATQAMQQKLKDAWDAAKKQDPQKREKIVEDWIKGRWKNDLDEGMRSSLDEQTISYEDKDDKMSVTFTNGNPTFEFELKKAEAGEVSAAASGEDAKEKSEDPEVEKKRLKLARKAWGEIETFIDAEVESANNGIFVKVQDVIESSTKEAYQALNDEQKKALANTTYIYGLAFGDDTAITFPASGYSASIKFKVNARANELNESPQIEEHTAEQLAQSGEAALQTQYKKAIDDTIAKAEEQNEKALDLVNDIVGNYIRHAYLEMSYPQKDALKGKVVTCEHRNVEFKITLPESGYNPNDLKIEKV